MHVLELKSKVCACDECGYTQRVFLKNNGKPLSTDSKCINPYCSKYGYREYINREDTNKLTEKYAGTIIPALHGLEKYVVISALSPDELLTVSQTNREFSKITKHSLELALTSRLQRP